MIGLTYTWHPAEDIVQQLETFPEADDKVEAPGADEPWRSLEFARGDPQGGALSTEVRI